MKKFSLILLSFCLLSTSVYADAGDEERYGWQWPIDLSHDDAGAYRAVLDRSVYEHIFRADLADLEVRNADGDPVPTDILGPEEPLAAGPQRVQIPLFDLPSETYRSSSWTISRETRSQGQIRRVETERNYELSGPPAGILLDASRIRDPIHALELSWPNVDSNPIDITVTVETSDDLESWQQILARGQLVDLHNDGDRVLKNRLEFRGARRYLRVRPLDGARQSFDMAHVIVKPPRGPAEWEWITLDGKPAESDDTVAFEFEITGRFPAARADLILDSNSAAEWTLESRDSADQSWRRRAGPWIGFQIDGDVDQRSRAQEFSSPTRDRYWRLTSSDSTGGVPGLRLGYRPEVLVFLASGDAPFSVVAGSATATRSQAPLERLLQTLRAELGSSWNPPPAYLGPIEELAGPGATEPPAPERDWTTMLLWAVLLIGTLLVAILALALLKNPESSDTQ